MRVHLALDVHEDGAAGEADGDHDNLHPERPVQVVLLDLKKEEIWKRKCPKTATQLMDSFVELNRRHGVTFVIATHDERVMAYARRLIRMQDGRIVSDEIQEPAGVEV